MANCLQSTTQADHVQARKDYIFKASGYTVTFDGFTVLYEEGKDEEEAGGRSAASRWKRIWLLKLKRNRGQPAFHPAAGPRYTEASLIKALEENGIGRP